MQQRKPKIGLLLLTAEWFIQIGASQGSFSSLPTDLENDSALIEATLQTKLEVVNPGVIATVEQVTQAVARFQAENVDCLVVNYLTWGEDRTILEAVQQMPAVPLMLWAHIPYRQLPDPLSMPEMFRASGPVGSLQASGALKRLDVKYAVAFGSYQDPRVVRQVVSFAKAAMVANQLKRARIGILPYRCDQMSATYVDEFRLKKELGPVLKYISTHDYLHISEQIPQSDVDAFIDHLKTTYPQSPNLTELGLQRGARVSLGLAEVVRQFNLDAIGIEDVGEELHRVVGIRPCLSVPELFEQAVVSMEAEVGGAVALLILRGLTGLPVMYTEVFTADERENCLLLGHAGMIDVRLAAEPREVLLEPDGEYVESEPDSAWMSFRAKGGEVTLLSVFCDSERFKLVITTGDALPGPRRLNGSAHAYVRMRTPISSFFEQALKTGMTQHWALVHADAVNELLALADILDLDKVIIQ